MPSAFRAGAGPAEPARTKPRCHSSHLRQTCRAAEPAGEWVPRPNVGKREQPGEAGNGQGPCMLARSSGFATSKFASSKSSRSAEPRLVVHRHPDMQSSSVTALLSPCRRRLERLRRAVKAVRPASGEGPVAIAPSMGETQRGWVLVSPFAWFCARRPKPVLAARAARRPGACTVAGAAVGAGGAEPARDGL